MSEKTRETVKTARPVKIARKATRKPKTTLPKQLAALDRTIKRLQGQRKRLIAAMVRELQRQL